MKEILKEIPINYNEYVGYKVKLNPTEEQMQKFIRYFGICRYVYNLGIDIEEEYLYDDPDNSYLNFISLNKRFTEIKNTNESHKWLSEKGTCDATTMKLVLKDVVMAYSLNRHYNGIYGYPRYKTKKNSKKQFPLRAERLTISRDEVFIPSIGWIKYFNSYGFSILGTGNSEKISGGKYLHYVNPRVIFDGINYYLTFSLPKDQDHNINSYKYYAGNTIWQEQPSSRAIGIDVGLRREKWMVDSTGYRVELPSFEKEDYKIAKLNEKLIRQYNENLKSRDPRFQDKEQISSKNMEKTKVKINKYYKKKINKRHAVIYEYTKRLLSLKPDAVVFESINVHNLIIHDYNKENNNHKEGKNRMIQNAAIKETMNIIENKLVSNGIPVYHVSDQYPSSQICSNCGCRYKTGKRSNFYRCPSCGLVINRDYNAALNLASQAYLKSVVRRL